MTKVKWTIKADKLNEQERKYLQSTIILGKSNYVSSKPLMHSQCRNSSKENKLKLCIPSTCRRELYKIRHHYSNMSLTIISFSQCSKLQVIKFDKNILIQKKEKK